MALAALVVKGQGLPGVEKLRITPAASEKSVKDLLGCKSSCAQCGGKIGQARVCTKCGTRNPETQYTTPNGQTWCKESVDAPYFEVKGRLTSGRLPYRHLVKDTYFVEVDASRYLTPDVCKALGRKAALIGYVKVTASSDERVAILHSPEKGILQLEVLYDIETEANRGIPIAAEPSRYTPIAEAYRNSISNMRGYAVAELGRREYHKAAKVVEKEVVTKATATRKVNGNESTKKAGR